LSAKRPTSPESFFGHPLYTDAIDYPTAVEIAVLRGETLHVQQFDNRRAARMTERRSWPLGVSAWEADLDG
jgi:hypothetical protein